MTNAEYKRVRVKNRKEMGLCIDCGKTQPITGRIVCVDCSVKRLEQHRRWREKAKSEGICKACCVGKLEHFRSLCDECGLKQRIRNRKSTGSKPKKTEGPGRPSFF